jgi:hypothetical protein
MDEYEESTPVRTVSGKRMACTGKFKYLGTTVSPSQGMSAELQRRATLARAGLEQTKKIWRSKILGPKLKKEFFSSLILSTLLYNCEVWRLDQKQWRFLKNEYHKAALMAMGERRRKIDEDGRYEDPKSFLTRHKLTPVHTLVTKRKAVWLGHTKRGGDSYGMNIFNVAKTKNWKWWADLTKDLAEYGTSQEDVFEKAQNPGAIKNIFNSVGRTVAQAT